MSEHVSKFVDDLSKGNNADAGEAFKDALRAKVADGLDKQRVDIASKIFSDVEAQPFSDPKPAVTDPSPETETMMDTHCSLYNAGCQIYPQRGSCTDSRKIRGCLAAVSR